MSILNVNELAKRDALGEDIISLPVGIHKEFFRTFLEFTLNNQNPSIQTHLVKGLIAGGTDEILQILDLFSCFHTQLEIENFFIEHFLKPMMKS